MHIKSMLITGFKSFKEQTEMRSFTRHIHALQVPNMDVVDAFHFVMGTGRWKGVIVDEFDNKLMR